MENCVNCGRKIKGNQDVPLCKKCCQCETIYEAQIVKICYDLRWALGLAVFIAAVATVLFVFTNFKHSDTAAILLYAYAAISFGFTGANCFARFIQLRSKAKKEQKQTNNLER